ncbi:MAG: amino acid adenylation domain-containing protein, partial [Mizugakiibacter sp.]|uniref:amino acid adenylation domain-containing protein n=1 Tax=Mizugakiibacter sp. TaxID=1972610 RepID=UPI003210711D
PDYMVPQHFVVLDALPLLPNGKLDRKALPAPADLAREPAREREIVAPRDDLERRIAAEMEAVLALPGLGIDDNFFELGGHSLLAAQLTARLNKALGLALPLRTLFEAPTVARLAEAVRTAAAEPDTARKAARTIPRRADRTRAPLSLMQQRLWFLEEIDPGRVVYNTPSAHRLLGPMDERAFERAFAAMIRRQPVLRTVIVKENGEPMQAILPQLEVALFPAEDLSALAPAAREETLRRRLAELTAQPFELVGAPLFRTHMFRLGAEEHVLFFMIHHLVWDGWSFDVLYEEMAALYPAACAGREATLPELAVDYGDFAIWHREWMQGEELAAQLAHWRKLLADGPEPLELPGDRPRPARMSGVGDNAWIHVPKPTVDALRELARRADATLYMALLALYFVLLQRHTGQRDLVVGTPVRGRDAPELEPVMGFFVNALPLRVQVEPDASFLDLVRAVRTVVVDAFSYPDVPFEHLLRALKLPRDESRFPIYQALFSFQDIRQRPEQWGALRHGRLQVMQPGAAEDLGLWFVEMEQGLSGGLGYNTDILDAASAERMRDRYLALLDAALADPAQPIGRLALMPDAERRRLEAWNATQAPYAADALMHEAFETQAARAPQRIAVRFGAQALSYGELEARANRIAHALRARGAQRGALVGLCLERGPDVLAALLGVLKSGAGYVPLDPAYPRERLAFMAEDAGLAQLVTTSDLAGLIAWPRERALWLGADLPAALPATPPRRDAAAATPESVAYVIYTSGSTGKPKGVMVPHRAVVNFLAGMRRAPGIDADDVLVAVTTLSFDIAVLELMLPLTAGAQVVLADRDTAMNGHALADLLETCGATMMQATPSTWRALLDARWSGDLAFTALCGGESMGAGLAAQLRARCKAVWNMYGPTETTVWSTCWRVEHPGEGISIGTPIANTQVWVLDAQRQPCPFGVPGELWIGGDGVALGYLNRPELTAERFLPDPFRNAPGARLYRTGDRGRWKPDGTLEHLGRL